MNAQGYSMKSGHTMKLVHDTLTFILVAATHHVYASALVQMLSTPCPFLYRVLATDN